MCNRQRPAGRAVDTEDLDIAETDDQLADTRRVLLHRGPPRNWCVSPRFWRSPNPTIADRPLISEEAVKGMLQALQPPFNPVLPGVS